MNKKKAIALVLGAAMLVGSLTGWRKQIRRAERKPQTAKQFWISGHLQRFTATS